MAASNWGDWLVSTEIEATDPGDGLAIWYLGCNGFVLRSAEATLYIDPYFGNGNPPTHVRMIPVPMDPADATVCDAVLVTHEHIDHMHPPSYGPLVNGLGADLYAPSAAYDEPGYGGDLRTPAARRNVIEPGDAIEIGDLTVHVRGAHDPDSLEPISYVVQHKSGTFFHGGDSKPADAFHDVGAEFDLDCGALAFGTTGRITFPDRNVVEPTTWYMDENQVVEAADALQLTRLLPTHYDMWRGMAADPKVLVEHAASFLYPRVIEPVRIGDRVDVSEPGTVTAQSLR